MTPRQKRRFKRQWDTQIEQERNGAPIPGDVAERMTKPKEQDPLWQVMITVRATGRVVPLGPMMLKDACGLCAEAVNRQIARGQRSDWSKAEIFPMTPISAGIN